MANTIPGSPESRMTSERRILTVLFCDVVSSTAMAEQLDPEEWTEIMNGAFQDTRQRGQLGGISCHL